MSKGTSAQGGPSGPRTGTLGTERCSRGRQRGFRAPIVVLHPRLARPLKISTFSSANPRASGAASISRGGARGDWRLRSCREGLADSGGLQARAYAHETRRPTRPGLSLVALISRSGTPGKGLGVEPGCPGGTPGRVLSLLPIARSRLSPTLSHLSSLCHFFPPLELAMAGESRAGESIALNLTTHRRRHRAKVLVRTGGRCLASQQRARPQRRP